MNHPITDKQRLLLKKYITYKILTNLWFLGAVWLYFYRIFITDQQVGVLDGFAFAIGLIAEVPSGALADRFGRDKMVKLGQVLAGSGLLIQAFGSSFVPFFVGQAITMIGISFVSGADDALFFENLNFDRSSINWRRSVTRGSQAALVGSLFAIATGGWLHSINPRIPWILTGLAFMSSTLTIWSIKDNRLKSKSKFFLVELQGHLISVKAGFVQFRTQKIIPYIPIVIIVQGLLYAAGWGLLRLVLLDRFHFNPTLGSLVVAMCSLITVWILTIMYKHAENISEKRVVILISLGAAASLLLSLADIGAWGFIVILVLYAGEHVLHPFMSEILNNRAPEDLRATVLSVASFLRMLPYVILAPIICYLNTRNELHYFLVIWSFLICLAALLYNHLKKIDVRVSLIKE